MVSFGEAKFSRPCSGVRTVHTFVERQSPAGGGATGPWRSSVGTSPSRTRSCGRPRPGPVVQRAVERHHRPESARAQRRRQQRDQPAVLLHLAQALERDGLRRRAATARPGTCVSDSVANRPSATAMTATPSRAHAAASSLVSASTAARAAPVCAIAGKPWWGETVTLTIVPRRRAHGQLVRGLAHRQRAVDVEPLDRAPALGGDALGGDEVLAAGVVEQEVEPPVALERAGDDRLGAGALADVRRPPTSTAPRPRPPPASSTSSRRPAITTDAPQRTSSAAAALPRLVPPPVTSATCPASTPSAKIARAPPAPTPPAP